MTAPSLAARVALVRKICAPIDRLIREDPEDPIVTYPVCFDFSKKPTSRTAAQAQAS